MKAKHPQVLNLSTKRKTQGLEAPSFLIPLRRKPRAFGPRLLKLSTKIKVGALKPRVFLLLKKKWQV
jgi:hypothetical protein